MAEGPAVCAENPDISAENPVTKGDSSPKNALHVDIVMMHVVIYIHILKPLKPKAFQICP